MCIYELYEIKFYDQPGKILNSFPINLDQLMQQPLPVYNRDTPLQMHHVTQLPIFPPPYANTQKDTPHFIQPLKTSIATRIISFLLTLDVTNNLFVLAVAPFQRPLHLVPVAILTLYLVLASFARISFMKKV